MHDFIGIGVGFAGTPASHSLTGSVPVRRAGMASGTADLQRDLGGAIMQSIFGALLTAGYASAVSSQIAASEQSVTDSTQAALTKSFASAEAVAVQYPQHANAIMEGLYAAAMEPSGTSYPIFGGFPVDIAGKTGTAERGEGREDQSWYAALAPYPDPEIVVVATLERGGLGADTAAPAVREILAQYFDVKSGEIEAVSDPAGGIYE